MSTYIAFLRAINVGGRFIKMADLRTGLSHKGFGDIASYIQSGNLRFTSSLRSAAKLELALETSLEELCGFTVRTIVRTPEQLAKVAAYGAGLEVPLEGEVRRYVTFLKDDPDDELIIRIILEEGDITSHLSFQWNLKTCAVLGNLGQLFGRPHDGPHGEPAQLLQRRLECELELGRRPKARREAKVSALDVARDIAKTLMGQPCSQIRHLDESSTDVDRAQESDVGRHQNVNVPRPTSRTVPLTKIVPAPSTARSRTEGRPIALPWLIRRRSPNSPLATNQPPRLAHAEPVAGSSMTALFWVKKRRASMVSGPVGAQR